MLLKSSKTLQILFFKLLFFFILLTIETDVVLESQALLVDLSIFPCSSIKFCITYFEYFL